MKVVFVGPHAIDKTIAPAAEKLALLGHAVLRFLELDALRHDLDTMRTMDVVVVSPAIKVDEGFIELAPNLRGIVSPFTGTEGFDEEAATRHQVIVANGQIPENSISMAEAAVMLVLCSLYDLHGTERTLRQNLGRPPASKSRMLWGKTVGIIGFGEIGSSIALRLSTWGVDMLVSTRSERPIPEYAESVALEELLKRSDAVILCASLNSQSYGMLTDERLRLMKTDVVFVNISRGGIAEDDVLARLAQERPEMKLALDVFDPEPLTADSPLRNLGNAILTPHMVGHTRESLSKLPVALEQNILDLLGGRHPTYVRNRSVLAAWSRRWSAGNGAA